MLKLKFKIIILAVVAFTSALFFNKTVVSASETFLTVIAGNKTYEFLPFEIGNYNGNYYLKNGETVVDGIYLDTIVRPTDSQVVFKDNGEFYLTEHKNGKQILKEQLIRDINYALNNQKSTVTANFTPIPPTVTKLDLQKRTVLRSTFTTSFPYSTEERKHNIHLAGSKINGTKLKNGEEFSFNKTVGARTEENGFKTAKVILNGSFVDGVGGGVCQVSSTLYNTAILSGLTITEHHNHSLLVSYVEPSFDAMVNSSGSDLKFINTTGEDIYISATTQNDKITFNVYGVPQAETYERVSVVKNTIQPEEILEVEDDTLPIGERVVSEYPKNGVESEGYLIKYVNGKRIKTIKLRSDKYKAMRGKVLIGTLDSTALSEPITEI